ncbi:hypothetical protein KZP23_16855 [Echinicola marina]|nr:hypothetical protein KZP23_16855 [Echinicola marina]
MAALRNIGKINQFCSQSCLNKFQISVF